MNLKNWLTLTIRAVDFNLVAQQPKLLKKLRELTIAAYSGLNYEMDRMLVGVDSGESIDCKVLLAYRFDKLVAWAILSKEETDFHFFNSDDGFKKEDGYLFQVYVDRDYRQQGIASELLYLAKKLVGNEVLCVCPHDEKSTQFFAKHSTTKMKYM
jgi:ribosomal protein S18 acetylase RimI-like enzyme